MSQRELSPLSSQDALTQSSIDQSPATSKKSDGRSCITCYRRKTKCDRKLPCSGCRKQQFECDYPISQPRRRKRRSETDVFKSHLEQLESLVQDLNKHVDREGQRATLPTSETEIDETQQLTTDLGRLVIEEGQSRYLENSFWQILSDKVCSIQRLLNEDNPADADGASFPDHERSSGRDFQGYFFGFTSLAADISIFHPNNTQLMHLWKVYKIYADPLVKVLHIRLTESKIVRWIKSLETGTDKAFEALLFAVYFASITTMSTSECRASLGQAKEVMLDRYRFAIQQALARADFLNSRNLVTLQALLIYLNCERSSDDNNLVWNITGVAVRIAQSLGIHRDGSAFNLSFFETEARRRVWWALYLLDVRTSENHGSNITQLSFLGDSKLPLNLDDATLDPSSPTIPEEQIGFSDMTLPLIRYEVITYFVRLRGEFYAAAKDQNSRTPDFHQVDEAMKECRSKIEDQYLKYCDPSKPFHWFVTIVARMMISRVWMNVLHPLQLGVEVGSLAKDRIFIASLETLEYWLILDTDERIRQWKWAFESYSPWQALAFALSELCTRGRNETMDRAWVTTTKAYSNWTKTITDRKHDLVWNRMKTLMEMAQRFRGDIGQEYHTGVRVDVQDYPETSIVPPETESTSNALENYQNSLNAFNLPNTSDSNQLSIVHWPTESDLQLGQNEDLVQTLALFNEGNNWW